ncbi:hypothetical protein GE09DRAFT_1090682 [Coniochaeta sp. 2T2.1]|nr:hypothetical protein GE09DRAFT_1090682 [Coniochaeta sp. 2T2.1]
MTTRTITTSNNSPTNFRNGLVRPLTTVFTQPSSGCAFPIPETDVWQFVFYSPGICPSGYTIGCSYSNNMGAPWTITPGETAALCVPT